MSLDQSLTHPHFLALFLPPSPSVCVSILFFWECAPYPPGWSCALRYTAHLLASANLLKAQQGSCATATGVGGVAWGGYARQLVQPFLDQVGAGAGIEEDEAILRDCVQVATAFVGGFKAAALQGNTRSGTMYP